MDNEINYLLRFEANEKEAMMIASYAKTRSEAVEQSENLMDKLGYTKTEIWSAFNLVLVCIVENKPKKKYYCLIDEASEEVYETVDNLDEAIEDAKSMSGHIQVVDYESGDILFDTHPNITHKI